MNLTAPLRRSRRGPVLRFSPPAWAKLLYLRDAGPSEVGAFGLCDRDDPLYVLDVLTVAQEAAPAGICLDDTAVADFFDAQVDAGHHPEQFARLWIHTHPGNSAEPSELDEETFQRVFGDCQWAVMLILARGGQVSARLTFHVGPGGQIDLPVEIDCSRAFPGSDEDAWAAEYQRHVRTRKASPAQSDTEGVWDDWPEELAGEDFEAMDEAERRAVLEDLGFEPEAPEEACLW